MVVQELLTRLQSPAKIAGHIRQRPQGGAELGGIMMQPWPVLPLLLDMIKNVVQPIKALPEVLDFFSKLQVLLV
jgi:hypothetical protein